MVEYKNSLYGIKSHNINHSHILIAKLLHAFQRLQWENFFLMGSRRQWVSIKMPDRNFHGCLSGYPSLFLLIECSDLCVNLKDAKLKLCSITSQALEVRNFNTDFYVRFWRNIQHFTELMKGYKFILLNYIFRLFLRKFLFLNVLTSFTTGTKFGN